MIDLKYRVLQRYLFCLIGVLLIFSLSGCVYFRLYQLKGQLSDFQKNFSVDNSGRPALMFKKPVVQEEDVLWLTGLSPTKRQAHGEVVTNLYHFIKIREPDATPGAYDELIFTFEYDQDKLNRITFPVQFQGFLTETNFIEMLSPIRDAKTDQGKKKTEWTWREMFIQIPSYERICHYLGKPSIASSNAQTRDPFFRYELKGQPPDDLFDFPLRMDYRVFQANNRMYDVTCNVGRVVVYIDVSKEDKSVKMDLRK